MVAGLLGLGLAAIFWLPAFGERHDIKLEGITQGFFDFRENFISLQEFVSLPTPLDRSAINPEFPLSLGPAQLIGAALGLLFVISHLSFVSRRGTRAQGGKGAGAQESEGAESTTRYPLLATRHPQFMHALFFAAFLLLYTLLALPISQAVWESVPLLELTEFPWRMLGPAVFCAAALSAAGWTIILRFTFYVLRNTPLNRRQNTVANAATISVVIFIIALNATIPVQRPVHSVGYTHPCRCLCLRSRFRGHRHHQHRRVFASLDAAASTAGNAVARL